MKVLTIGTFHCLFIWTYLFDPIWDVNKLNKDDRITETYIWITEISTLEISEVCFFVLDYTSNYKKSNLFTKIFPFLLKPVSWFDLHIDLLVAIWKKQSVAVYRLSKTTEHHKQWVLKLSVFRVFLAHTFPHSDWMRRLIE